MLDDSVAVRVSIRLAKRCMGYMVDASVGLTSVANLGALGIVWIVEYGWSP